MSMATESEGLVSLKDRADGLIKRLVYSVLQISMCSIAYLNILDTDKLDSNHQSLFTLTGIAVVSLAPPKRHNFLMSGTNLN